MGKRRKCFEHRPNQKSPSTNNETFSEPIYLLYAKRDGGDSSPIEGEDGFGGRSKGVSLPFRLFSYTGSLPCLSGTDIERDTCHVYTGQ